MKDIGVVIDQHPKAYRLVVGIVCALATFALSELVSAIPNLNDALLLRPASALGPSLGLFLGWPAIVGCTAGTLATEALHEGDLVLLALRTVVHLACNALPYVAWYFIKRKSDRPYPRFDSTGKTTLALVLFTVDALALAILMAPLENAVTTAMDIDEARFLNAFLFCIYLGLPLLILIDRMGLRPVPPRFVTVPYVPNRSMNLTQRILTYLLITVIVAVLLFILIGASPLFLSEEEMGQSFFENIASIYVICAAFTVFLFTPMLLVLHQLEQQFARPAEVLSEASRDFVALVAEHRDNPAEALAASDIDTEGIKPRHEMADLFASTNAMRHDIVRYVDQLGRAVAERERTATELSIASQIQVDAVPRDFSFLRERYQLETAAMLKPAREVGGDFYDTFALSDDRVGLVMADVSGKGMPAALFMMRAMAEIREKMRSYDDVGEALTKANQTLCERNDTMLFVTVFACTLNTRTGELLYANAGHNPPWLTRSGVGAWLQFDKPQLVMGALAIMRYRSHSLYLMPGDSLLLYTDGVTEAANMNEALFADDRLKSAIQEAAEPTPQARIENIIDRIDSFVGEAPQADDITILAVNWDVPVHRLDTLPTLDALEDLYAFIDPLCQGEGRTQKMLFDVRLALEEVFVNVVKHGFSDGRPIQPVQLSAAVDEQAKRLHVRMADAGVPYDPLGYRPERVEAERGMNNKIGGLGILLVRTIAESLSYEYVDGMNVLRFTKDFV